MTGRYKSTVRQGGTGQSTFAENEILVGNGEGPVQTIPQSTFATPANISDTTYDATTWDGVTTIAPSKNAIRDRLEAAASETVRSLIELATGAEALAGSDTTRAVTSAGLASSKSLSTSGYMKFPGGLIIQWASPQSDASGDGTWTFPTAFASACYAVSFIDINGDTGRYYTTGAPSTTSVAFYSNIVVASTMMAIAVGV